MKIISERCHKAESHEARRKKKTWSSQKLFLMNSNFQICSVWNLNVLSCVRHLSTWCLDGVGRRWRKKKVSSCRERSKFRERALEKKVSSMSAKVGRKVGANGKRWQSCGGGKMLEGMKSEFPQQLFCPFYPSIVIALDVVWHMVGLSIPTTARRRTLSFSFHSTIKSETKPSGNRWAQKVTNPNESRWEGWIWRGEWPLR